MYKSGIIGSNQVLNHSTIVNSAVICLTLVGFSALHRELFVKSQICCGIVLRIFTLNIHTLVSAIILLSVVVLLVIWINGNLLSISEPSVLLT